MQETFVTGAGDLQGLDLEEEGRASGSRKFPDGIGEISGKKFAEVRNATPPTFTPC
jgi:hypothetical protein